MINTHNKITNKNTLMAGLYFVTNEVPHVFIECVALKLINNCRIVYINICKTFFPSTDKIFFLNFH